MTRSWIGLFRHCPQEGGDGLKRVTGAARIQIIWEVHEAGDVSAVNEAVIRPGQCFSVEPGIYIPEEGIGVRIEDLVLITEDGCEVLNHYPKELTVIPFH